MFKNSPLIMFSTYVYLHHSLTQCHACSLPPQQNKFWAVLTHFPSSSYSVTTLWIQPSSILFRWVYTPAFCYITPSTVFFTSMSVTLSILEPSAILHQQSISVNGDQFWSCNIIVHDWAFPHIALLPDWRESASRSLGKYIMLKDQSLCLGINVTVWIYNSLA